MKKAPLAAVRERFESKEALVDELIASGLVDRDEEEGQDGLRARLLKVPSSKLIRIHRQVGDLRDRFGDRDGLLDALCKLKFEGRKVEDAWRDKASGWSNGRLLDLHGSLSRRAGRSGAGSSA